MKIGLGKIIELSVFSSLVVSLHTIESFLNPTFFKIGLGNAVVLYLILNRRTSTALITTLLKIAAYGFLSGSFLSPVFFAVLFASISSFTLMAVFIRVLKTGPIGASIPASCAHNLVILLFAEILIRGITSSLFPFVFAFSVLTGFITGWAAFISLKTLKNLDTKKDEYKITF
ncbi:Gx transporter family protein [candidate division WOR-3 bacterium]|nr:Gx transporter family protein [candidate division WOR-3 bacterium]